MKPNGQEHADDGVRDDERSVGSGSGHAASKEIVAGEAADQCSQRRRKRANEVVPGEDGGAVVIRDRLRECRLFNREERPHFLVAGAEHADRGDETSRKRSCR